MAAITFTENIMITKLLSKPLLQSTLSNCRALGYTVAKLSAGYTVHDDDHLVLKAMNGNTAYLTRLNPDYFLQLESGHFFTL